MIRHDICTSKYFSLPKIYDRSWTRYTSHYNGRFGAMHHFFVCCHNRSRLEVAFFSVMLLLSVFRVFCVFLVFLFVLSLLLVLSLDLSINLSNYGSSHISMFIGKTLFLHFPKSQLDVETIWKLYLCLPPYYYLLFWWIFLCVKNVFFSVVGVGFFEVLIIWMFVFVFSSSLSFRHAFLFCLCPIYLFIGANNLMWSVIKIEFFVEFIDSTEIIGWEEQAFQTQSLKKVFILNQLIFHFRNENAQFSVGEICQFHRSGKFSLKN